MIQFLTLLVLIEASLLDAIEELQTAEHFLMQPITNDAEKLTGQALVDYVNKHQQLFKAEHSQHPLEWFKSRLMDEKYLELPKGIKQLDAVGNDEELPESFDARQKWPKCLSISTIRDQSRCGSCWAVAAASTISDRVCVQSQERKKIVLSDTDILTCCEECFLSNGCEGGFSNIAWIYVNETGICTGGRFKAKGVCKPYIFHPCGEHPGQIYYGECPKKSWEAPGCSKFCQHGYPTPYEKDKIYAKSVYYVDSDERSIRKEIMTNGPVQAGFTVYEDFRHYKSGIYKYTGGKMLGGHAVRVIGWGTDNGTDYWLIANSWNSDWGEDGYFRFIRGTNHCHIETNVLGGMMEV